MLEPLGDLPSPPEPNYFHGEQLSFSDAELGATRSSGDDDLNLRYATGEVRIVTEQARYPLNTISGMVSGDDYELNPEFQRRHRWNAGKQSRLIESFIMNVPVPPIFLYEDEFSHYEVMDGLQRLTAISAFYNDELTLVGLEEWPELNGRKYSDLPEQIRRGVDRRYLSSIILLRETAKTALEAERLKQLVFERINSGGVALKEQETRNAIYNGRLNKLCIKLSRNEHLCRMWGIPLPTPEEEAGDIPDELEQNTHYRTMHDVELVLRFFAHRQRRRIGTGALRTYLDSYLKKGNLYPEETLDNLESLFVETIALVHEVLGDRAFWLWRFRHNKWGWLERPTTTAYDAFMFVFSQNLHRAPALRAASDAFRKEIPAFYEQYVEYFDARMTNMRNLRERDSLVSLFVDKVLSRGSA
ncbi:DUF262 domain-containing protein [Streptomyces sp. NPDC012888]|uniref:DUF262 domain-containing protein n=1 Tax=Streptomyces sp. NPDC012888 TaxID=3364855 RepID=UPI0036BCD2AF